MADEEVVRLLFEADDSQIKRADATVVATTADVYEFADVYELVEKEIKKANAALDAADHAMEELANHTEVATAATRKLAKSKQSLASASKAASKGTLDLGRAALETSRGLEDLQYGVAGVVNNIPSMVTAVGGSMGAAAAFSLLAIGITQVVKHWDDLMNLFREHHEIPRAADAVERLGDELKKNNKELDALKEKTSLSNDQLKRFNELTAENVRLEKEKTEALAKQKALKEFTESQGKEQKGRGSAFEEATAGRGKEVLDKLQAAIKGESEEAIRREESKARGDYASIDRSDASDQEKIDRKDARWRQLQETIARERGQDFKALAEDLVVRLKQGDAGAAAYFQRIATSGYKGGNLLDVATKFNAALPENKKKAKDQAELEENNLKHESAGNFQAIDKEAKQFIADWGKKWTEEIHKLNEQSSLTAEEFDRRARRIYAQSFRQRGAGEQAANLAAAELVEHARKTYGDYRLGKEREHKERVAKLPGEQAKANEQAAEAHEKEQAELEKGLGDEFLARAQMQMLEINSLPGAQRAKAQRQFLAQFQELARRRLIASGMDQGRAAVLAPGALGFVNQDLTRQVNAIRGANPGANAEQARGALYQGLRQNLQFGAQGLKNQEKLIGISQEMGGQIEALEAQQRRHARAIDSLARQTRSRGRSRQNSGFGAGAGAP